MLPGLTRTAAQPASIAANTYLGWKWMSAMTGIWDFRAMAGSASASSWDGTATRTIWQPAAVSSAICCRVALTSAVSVVVIDCTETGAPPPTGTEPTMIWRDFRRSASGSGGAGRHTEVNTHEPHPFNWHIPESLDPSPLNHHLGNGRLTTLTETSGNQTAAAGLGGGPGQLSH